MGLGITMRNLSTHYDIRKRLNEGWADVEVVT